MKTELLYLALVTTFTGLLWVPYVLDRIAVGGLIEAVGYPANPKPQSPWAQRLKKAHANAIENLVVLDRKSTRLNSSHPRLSRMPSSA